MMIFAYIIVRPWLHSGCGLVNPFVLVELKTCLTTLLIVHQQTTLQKIFEGKL